MRGGGGDGLADEGAGVGAVVLVAATIKAAVVAGMATRVGAATSKGSGECSVVALGGGNEAERVAGRRRRRPGCC